MLEDSFGREGIVKWNNPQGGYFINLEIESHKADAVYNYCKQHNVGITPAGSTYPYGVDEENKSIRLAPTYPTLQELESALKVLCDGIRKFS